MQTYPNDTGTFVTLSRLIRPDRPLGASARLSGRMIPAAAQLAAGHFLGWQLSLPQGRAAQLSLFGSADVNERDLCWMAESIATTSTGETPVLPPISVVYTLALPSSQRRRSTVGFTAAQDAGADPLWPQRFSAQFPELCAALRETGGALRFAVGPAAEDERAACRLAVEKTWRRGDLPAEDYLGTPVRAQMLVGLPESASVRLRTVLGAAIPGAVLTPAEAEDWDAPLQSAPTLPDYAARILALEPIADDRLIPGVETCDPPAPTLPMTFEPTADAGAITIGRAETAGGDERAVPMGLKDLCRHWQIIGQTGTGKSTLLAHSICSAIEGGHGLTFFDPHGTTIDAVLRMLPKKAAKRVQVLRLGDADHPIPLSLWSGFDPDKEERLVSDLAALFMEIFDKRQQGIAGPRWERWYTLFQKSAIAALGPQASFESVVFFSQSKDALCKLIFALREKHPDLARALETEYAGNDGRDYADLVNWCVSKFQRLTGVAQLRNTFGAGANALDFSRLIDTDTVTLIDLASPVMGMHAARVLGTILLQKLWIAAQERRDRSRTHLVFLDEMHLFQHVLPQMLAEGRKFGLALVLAHQHCGQLNDEVREALDANSASFSAFRLSARDAREATLRLKDESLLPALCRLDAFRAVTTVSADGRQSDPFTLFIPKPKLRSENDAVARGIERRSREKLSLAYAEARPLTTDEILERLERPAPEYEELEYLFEDDFDASFDDDLDEPPAPAPVVPARPAWLQNFQNQLTSEEESYADNNLAI